MGSEEKLLSISTRIRRLSIESRQRKPLLSICMPTFNRAEKLERMLGWLQEQARGVESEVEICISSNGSTDSTDSVAAKWASALPIAYRKNGRNQGFDFNMLSAIKMAKGRYCWCFGDDDQPMEGAVKSVLADIKSLGKREVGAIYINLSHNPNYLNGRKFSNLPDGPFKVYSVAEASYAPLSLLHLGLICLNRRAAGEIIEKKVYLEGDRVCKRERDPNVLHLWIQAYLFLECIKKSGFFGIEPKSMVRLVSDGESTSSYGKKMYFDIASFNYIYDIRKNYPDFNGDFFAVRMMGHFLRVVMVCENPALEDAYLAASQVFVALLKMDGRHRDIRLVRMLEAMRKMPLVPRMIPMAYRAFLFFRGKGNALRNREETSQELAENLKFVTGNTREKFKG